MNPLSNGGVTSHSHARFLGCLAAGGAGGMSSDLVPTHSVEDVAGTPRQDLSSQTCWRRKTVERAADSSPLASPTPRVGSAAICQAGVALFFQVGLETNLL